MSTLALALIAVTLLAGTAAAFAETVGPSVSGVLKMVAATAYLGFALQQGALATPYGVLVLAALGLSWLGDLFLIGTARRLFLAGLGAFLLAHVAYAAAFLHAGVTAGATAVAAVVMATVGGGVYGWLSKAGLPRPMGVPVIAYLVAIAVMVAFAAGTGSTTVLLGAAAFAVSDIFVARNRFVVRAPINRRLGLPLYFAAQLLLAGSV